MESKRKKLKSLFMSVAISFVALSASAKDHLYVKAGADGDGSSWSKAMGNLQQAVDSAAKRGVDVWVAKGVYKSDSSAVVFLKPNVSLYGGFAGTETTLAARDTALNPTVLDGNDSIQVINQEKDFADSTSVVVDGFSIQNGYATNGGGAYLRKNATINNCIVKVCRARLGASVYSKGGKVANTIICHNTAISGGFSNDGVLYLEGGVVDSCVAYNNTAGWNGVLMCSNSVVSNTTIKNNKYGFYNCVDVNNSQLINVELLDNTGGEQFICSSRSSFDRCLIKNNSCTYKLLDFSRSTLSNTLIVNNNYAYYFLNLSSGSSMLNCTIANNSGKRTFISGSKDSKIQNSIIFGNTISERNNPVLADACVNIVSHSMVQDGAFGEGNIVASVDKVAFADPENGDYSLLEKSYGINSGVDVDDALDLLGNPRKQGGAVDMGAIESAFEKVPDAIKCGEIVYVKSGAEGDGSSWDSAFGEVQQAILAASVDGKSHQIWIAKGTYFGDTLSNNAVTLSNGISLYGGFAGTESALDERDAAKNITIIDGASKRRCIIQNYVFTDSMAVVVDGITIQNGSLNNNAGVNAKVKNTTFNNCVFTNSRVGNEGVYAENSVFKNCKFTKNNIQELEGYGIVVDSCVFSESASIFTYSAVYLSKSTLSNSQMYGYNIKNNVLDVNESTVENTIIRDNTTTVSHLIRSNATLWSSSLIYGNNVESTNGNVLYIYGSSDVTNATIAHNKTKNVGAVGFYLTNKNVFASITNSIVYGNKETNAVVPQVPSHDNLKVRYSASDDDLTGENNIKLATANNGSDSTKNYVCFVNAAGGDFRLHVTSSCIDKGLDSVMTAKGDVYGGARIYGKAIDLGAIEFDGEYAQMLDYGQVVCNNSNTFEVKFDSTISKIDWKIDFAGKVTGFEQTSGSGVSIPSMLLQTSSSEVDMMSLVVTPYDKDSVAGVPFAYNYTVYPDFLKNKITIVRPKSSDEVNVKSTDFMVEWNTLSLPVEVERYDLYVWKSTENMPSVPFGSFLKDHSKKLTDLDNHTIYNFMVKAVTACDTVISDTMQFKIDVPESLEISGSAVCELGTKLNTETSATRYVKGFELKDSITYVISGKDSLDFSVKLLNNWNPLTGGYYAVYYNPTDSKKPLSTATLTFKSGSYTAEMQLKGILANYYVFDVVVEKEEYKAGDTIAIKGLVMDAYEVPLENKHVKISVYKSGAVIKEFMAISDANGEVSAKYISSPYESGVYGIGLSLDGEKSETIYGEFNIPGITCSLGTDRWLVQKGDTVRGSITVVNRSKVEAHGIKIKTLTLANGCKVVFDTLDVLKGLETEKISYYVTGDSLTVGNNYILSTFRVETAEGLSSNFTSYFYCEAPYGQIKVLPANIKEYVSKQNPKLIELMLCNTGLGETGKVSVSLPKNIEGISMPNGTEIESIKAGDTVKTVLKLAYYDGAKLNTPISGIIGVNCENGKSTSINYEFQYTSSSIGSVDVDVVDEYFYNSTSKKHLAGATVEIKHAFNNSVIATGTTDSTGKLHLDSIPEGDYVLLVKADKHDTYKELISVQAGQNLDKFVFVSFQAVTYTWNVERVEIEDKYEYELKTEYETNVPAPVVTIKFIDDIPARESFAPGDKKVVYLMVANHGLIAAKDVEIFAPEVEGFKFSFDVNRIDSLPANYAMSIPLLMERLADIKDTTNVVPAIPTPDGSSDAGNGAGPGSGSGDSSDSGNGSGDGSDSGSGTGSGSGSGDGSDDGSGDGSGSGHTPNDPPIPIGGPGNPGVYHPLGTGSGCPSLKIKWWYDCGGKVEKVGEINIWRCDYIFDDIHFTGNGSEHGAAISTYVYGDCNDTCHIRVKTLILCLADIIGALDPTGLVSAGTAGFSLGNTTGTLLSDVVKGGGSLTERQEASYAYSYKTWLLGLVTSIPFDCYDLLCQLYSCRVNGRQAENCGEFVYDMNHPAERPSPLRVATLANADFYNSATPDLLATHDYLEYAKFEASRNRLFSECTGLSVSALSTSGAKTFMDYAIDSISSLGKIDAEGVKKLPVSDLSLTEMLEITERWNNSMDAWKAGVTDSSNIVSKKVYDECLANIDNFFRYVLFRNFKDIDEMHQFIAKNMETKPRKSVCASVKLHMSQTMSMTREAFDGTLTVNNGNETVDMDNFKVVLEIRDEKGNLANDLFQINTLSLDGIDAVDGSSMIASGSEATSVFRFIPTTKAAPENPANYSFGGKIVYVEDGDTITMDLVPVILTVYPSPDLKVDYFVQRNVLGDDALTETRVEPSVPAVIGVRIDNQGYGVAKNVKLETAQPEIVDNEKGLLIDFEFIGSSLNGKDCNLGSENIDFGNIDAQLAKTGVWWLTSSLLGHFTKYEANVVHTTGFGNPELSLVNGIEVHELVKTVDAYGTKEDGVVDFLVNDVEDGNDTPDAIYYSNGGKDSVKVVKSAILDKNSVGSADTIVKLTVTPSEAGWNYAQMNDPGNNCYDIKKVVRVKDSVEIPLSNVWTTFVTLPDGKEPIYENRLHFLDNMTTLGENEYDIHYSVRKNILTVTELTGMPKNEETVKTSVDSIVVEFNRKIQKSTFDYKDIELYCQGGNNLSDSTIKVKQIDDFRYAVNISSKTDTSGFYRIEINVNDIFDEAGYPGEVGMTASWIQFIESSDDSDQPADDGNDEDADDPEGDEGDDNPYDDFETVVEGIEIDDIVVYVNHNSIYVKSTKDGSLDIYDMLSRLVVKNAQYGIGVTNVATLPKGIYVIEGQKVILR